MTGLKKTISLILLVTLFGCNAAQNIAGGTSSDTQTKNPTTEKSLVLNMKTEVIEGDTYEARSADALIDVEHDTGLNKKYVTLIQGKGSIISSK